MHFWCAALLAKKDRGRGADLVSAPQGYGHTNVAERIDGAELLQQALLDGDSDDDDVVEGSADDYGDGNDVDDDNDDDHDEGSEEEENQLEGESEGEGELEESEEKEGVNSDEANSALDAVGDGDDGDDDDTDDDDGVIGKEVGSSGHAQEETPQQHIVLGHSSADAEPSSAGRDDDDVLEKQTTKKQLQQQQGSIASLKRQLADAQSQNAAMQSDDPVGGGTSTAAALPLEMERILTEDDFKRIQELKHRKMVDAAMSRHGLKTASKHKQQRLLETAEAEAQEAMAVAQARSKIGEARVNPESLAGEAGGVDGCAYHAFSLCFCLLGKQH